MATAKNKTIENNNSVSDFINRIEDQKKKADSTFINQLIIEQTCETPKMWGSSIVGYGSYHYKYKSGREGDFMKIGFSPRKQNLTIYIMPGFGRYEVLLQKLGKYKIGKSCLYVKKIEDININILKELVRASYDYMTDKYG